MRDEEKQSLEAGSPGNEREEGKRQWRKRVGIETGFQARMVLAFGGKGEEEVGTKEAVKKV